MRWTKLGVGEGEEAQSPGESQGDAEGAASRGPIWAQACGGETSPVKSKSTMPAATSSSVRFPPGLNHL